MLQPRVHSRHVHVSLAGGQLPPLSLDVSYYQLPVFASVCPRKASLRLSASVLHTTGTGPWSAPAEYHCVWSCCVPGVALHVVPGSVTLPWTYSVRWSYFFLPTASTHLHRSQGAFPCVVSIHSQECPPYRRMCGKSTGIFPDIGCNIHTRFSPFWASAYSCIQGGWEVLKIPLHFSRVSVILWDDFLVIFPGDCGGEGGRKIAERASCFSRLWAEGGTPEASLFIRQCHSIPSLRRGWDRTAKNTHHHLSSQSPHLPKLSRCCLSKEILKLSWKCSQNKWSVRQWLVVKTLWGPHGEYRQILLAQPQSPGSWVEILTWSPVACERNTFITWTGQWDASLELLWTPPHSQGFSRDPASPDLGQLWNNDQNKWMFFVDRCSWGWECVSPSSEFRLVLEQFGDWA